MSTSSVGGGHGYVMAKCWGIPVHHGVIWGIYTGISLMRTIHSPHAFVTFGTVPVPPTSQDPPITLASAYPIHA